jgi:glutathione S-transferase
MSAISEHPKSAEDISLYWISGSPPSWRVMLALLLKQTPYQSKQLDYSNKENRSSSYLALNPTGQVPTLVHGQTIVRESIAILAYIDRAFDGPAIFGQSLEETASIWQTVMDFENNLRPDVTSIAQILLRDQSENRKKELEDAGKQFFNWLERIENKLSYSQWICGGAPSAADCWLYPSIAWVERAAKVSKSTLSERFVTPFADFTNLSTWKQQMEGLEGFEATTPPHWT